METYSIKKFIFDPHIAYQSYKLTGELPLTRKEVLFILENLKLKKKSYDHISKTLFIPYPTPKFVKNPHAIICQKSPASLFLHFFKDFETSKSCMIEFGIRFQRFALKKNSSTLSYRLKSTSKSKNLNIWSKISNFSSIVYKKNQLTWCEDLQRCYFYQFFFLLLLILAVFFLFLQQTTFAHIFLRLLLCTVLLIWIT